MGEAVMTAETLVRVGLAVFMCALFMTIASATGAYLPIHTQVILVVAAGACGWLWPDPK